MIVWFHHFWDHMYHLCFIHIIRCFYLFFIRQTLILNICILILHLICVENVLMLFCKVGQTYSLKSLTRKRFKTSYTNMKQSEYYLLTLIGFYQCK